MASPPNYRRVAVDGLPHFNAGLKLAWAKKHLDAFNVEVSRFLNGKTHTLRTEDDFEAGEYIVYLDVEPLPVELGLIAGDFLCCLRSSLDHLACALTLTPRGTRNDQASFPIIPRDNADGKKLLAKSVTGVPEDAVTIIKLLQPYHHGDAYKVTKLWKLHRLWNIDKHRRIPLHGSHAQAPIRFPTDMPPISGGTDNSGILRFPLVAKPHIEFDPMIEFSIYLGDETEGIIIRAQELIEIYNLVRYDVVPRFVHFFQGREENG